MSLEFIHWFWASSAAEVGHHRSGPFHAFRLLSDWCKRQDKGGFWERRPDRLESTRTRTMPDASTPNNVKHVLDSAHSHLINPLNLRHPLVPCFCLCYLWNFQSLSRLCDRCLKYHLKFSAHNCPIQFQFSSMAKFPILIDQLRSSETRINFKDFLIILLSSALPVDYH